MTDIRDPAHEDGTGSFSSNTRARAVGSGVANLVRYLAFILLSAILGPGEMGRMALALVIVEILDSLKGAGFGQLIVQRKSLSANFLHSVGTLQLVVVFTLASAMVGTAQWTGQWMGDATIAPVVMALAFSLILSGVSFVHMNLMIRQLRFDTLAKIEVVQAVLYATVAIALALSGFGIWSMVIGHLTREACASILILVVSGHRARLRWNRKVIAESLGFASSIVGSTLLNATMSRVDLVIVGRLLGTEALGVYALAKRLILYPTHVLGMILNSVLLSTISRIQDDHAAIRDFYLRVCSVLALIAFPAVFGLAAVSEPFTTAILDERWSQAGLLILLLCPAGAVQVLTITTTSLYISQGRPDLLLKWSLVYYACITAAYAWAASVSVIWVPVAESTVMLALAAPAFVIPFRLVGLRLPSLLRAIRVPLIAALVMAAIVYASVNTLTGLGLGAWSCLTIGVLMGAAMYLGLMYVARRDLLHEVFFALTRRTRRV